jgi:hypothetical protein
MNCLKNMGATFVFILVLLSLMTVSLILQKYHSRLTQYAISLIPF